MSAVTTIDTPKGVLKIYPTRWTYLSSSCMASAHPEGGLTWVGDDPGHEESEAIYRALWAHGRYEDCRSLSRTTAQALDLEMELYSDERQARLNAEDDLEDLELLTRELEYDLVDLELKLREVRASRARAECFAATLTLAVVVFFLSLLFFT